jgi:hypothetical protein
MYSWGMAKQAVSIRIDTGLWAWLEGYAKARGSNRTAVIEAAVRSLRGDAAGGVPELGTAQGHGASSAGEVRRPAARPPSASPRVPARAGRQDQPVWMNDAMKRQLKLNKAKERNG